jgi:hypothetical protein
MILIHIDMIAMHVYICCRYKPRNDALIHSTIQWKNNENARGGVMHQKKIVEDYIKKFIQSKKMIYL